MTREKITKIIVFLNEGSLLLLIFFLPLYFSFFYQAIPSFLINVAIDRAAVFKMAVALLVFLTLARVVLEGEISVRANKKQLLAVFLVLCSAAAATIFSVDRHTSFWGSNTRQQGLIIAFYCFLFFLTLVINLRGRKQTDRLLSAAVLAGSLAAGFGILQWLGLDLLFRKPLLNPDNRIGSTLGHPVFLGNFLLLVLPLACYKFFAAAKNHYKALFLLAAIIQFAALILTLSRGAWLGFALSCVLSAMLYLFYFRRKFIRPLILAFGIIIVAAAGIFSLKNRIMDTAVGPKNSASSFSTRLTSIIDLKSGSVALRLKYWPAALRGFVERPVFGYGLDAQYLPLFQAYDPSWMIYEEVNSTADRAHNEYLDILLTSGAFGLIAFVVLLVLFIGPACRYYGRSRGADCLLIFFLLAGTFAYLGALLFNFSTIETKVYFWLYLGVMSVVLPDYEPQIRLKIAGLWAGYRFTLIYAVAMSAIILPLLVLSQVNEVQADYRYQQARFSERNRNYIGMINNYLEAIHLNPHDELYRADFAVALINAGITETIGQDQASTSLLVYLDEQLEFDRGLQDNYFRSLTRAITYSIYGKYRDPAYYQRAEEIYRRLEKANPAFLNLHKNWALLNIQQGRYDEAIERDKRLFGYLPDLNDPYLNDVHRAQIGAFLSDVYSDIAFAQAANSRIEDSIATNLYALRLNPTNPRFYKKIAELYWSQGKLKEAIFYSRHGLTLAPADRELYRILIYISKEQGDLNSARYYLDRAIEQSLDVKEFEALVN